ncbi:unnamed protein product [Protopolystoma xenopodis]|uniref:Uncharacterized protein n=1 Tax=Protopolystoma xenopodis TaxID=117903 RepID=A0A3S5C0V0_9PLAT|nr:unnamed protein product [Protopolystoma xenopodis]
MAKVAASLAGCVGAHFEAAPGPCPPASLRDTSASQAPSTSCFALRPSVCPSVSSCLVPPPFLHLPPRPPPHPTSAHPRPGPPSYPDSLGLTPFSRARGQNTPEAPREHPHA